MEIQGSLETHVTKVTLVEHRYSDGQKATVDCSVRVKLSEAEAWGKTFALIAFGDRFEIAGETNGGEAVTRFGYDSKQLPKWVKMSHHKVTACGIEQQIQPQVRNILAGKDKESVTVQLRLVFDTLRKKAIAGALANACGTDQLIEMEPVQPDLPNTAETEKDGVYRASDDSEGTYQPSEAADGH